MSKNILAITGSYRKEGIIHQAVEIVVSALEQRMQTVEVLDLLDYHVEFCTNCRQCAQQPGDDPGKCHLADDMTLIIAKIEQADALLLAAPVNFGAITALYKRFMERLICYAYWPYEKEYPTFRKKSHNKPAILITSTAMPGTMARFTTNAMHSLNFTAKTVGTKPVEKIYIGRAAHSTDMILPQSIKKKLQAAAKKMA